MVATTVLEPELIIPKEIFPENLASRGFLTPTPYLLPDGTIRVYGGMRDSQGVSRIGWAEIDPNTKSISAVCEAPVMGLGDEGTFDHDGMILGDVFEDPISGNLCLYYVGFSKFPSVKFRAFTGLAYSTDGGINFMRAQNSPVFGANVLGKAAVITAVHSVRQAKSGWEALIAIGDSWEEIGGAPFPRYNSYFASGPDLARLKIHHDPLPTPPGLYRFGRPRFEDHASGEMRFVATGGKVNGDYRAYAFVKGESEWEQLDTPYPVNISPGCHPAAALQAAYPAQLRLGNGEVWVFFNGDNMGESGAIAAIWRDELPRD